MVENVSILALSRYNDSGWVYTTTRIPSHERFPLHN